MPRAKTHTSSTIKWRRFVNGSRCVFTNGVHWDKHLLSRATLHPVGFRLSCNICAFCVNMHRHVILFLVSQQMSHFPSYFCCFFFSTILFYLMFVPFFCLYLYFSNFRVHLSSLFLLLRHINSHCPRRPIQEGEVCL
jgi:hypothetical protein